MKYFIPKYFMLSEYTRFLSMVHGPWTMDYLLQLPNLVIIKLNRFNNVRQVVIPV